jgi:hypothetical protein
VAEKAAGLGTFRPVGLLLLLFPSQFLLIVEIMDKLKIDGGP